jgi:putative DNA primase/helicase
MAEPFITQVVATALSRFDEVMSYCGMAGGKDQVREYLALNPKRSDSKLGSLSVNRDSGAGSDFATGETWGDLVAMTAWRFDCSQTDAAERLADLLGIAKPNRQKRTTGGNRQPGYAHAPTPPKQTPVAPASRKPAPDAEGWECVIPVPDDAPPPPAVNPRQGKPSIRYEYRTAAGRLGFLIDRYQGKDGKSFAQLTFWRNAAGRTEWRWKSPPAPRLLYGLELLAARPDAPVIACEGEKAAEAARTLAPEFVCISWPGGSNAVDKADWLPLAGRDVTLWADLDEPGAACMAKLAGIVAALPSQPAALYQVKPQAFGLSAKGDDAADLLGWDAARFADVCTATEWRVAVDRPKSAKTEAPTAKASKSAKENAPAGTPRTCYTLEVGGVYFTDTDRDGN